MIVPSPHSFIDGIMALVNADARVRLTSKGHLHGRRMYRLKRSVTLIPGLLRSKVFNDLLNNWEDLVVNSPRLHMYRGLLII